MSKQKNRRKAIPLGVKLQAALRRFGLKLEDVEFDHNPALALRDWNPVTNDTIPPANDPDFIDMLLVDEHRSKTFGPGGEKRITTAGSDINRISKVARLSKEHEAFQRRLLAKVGPSEKAAEQKPRTKIKSRGFPKSTRRFGR